MNLNTVLADIKKSGPGRELTEAETAELLAHGTWMQLCEATLCARGADVRLRERMRELKP